MTLALVVEHGSFTRAADELAISQPSVSQQIRELERACGLPVLLQRGRTLVPTPLGTELADIGRRIRISERLAEKRIAEHRSGQAGRLTIGASMTTGVYLLPALLAAFTRERPAVEIGLEIHNTAEVAQATADETIDVGIVEGTVARPELAVEPFATDTLVCIANPAHPLAEFFGLPVERLSDAVLVQRERGSGTRETLLRALDARGFAFARTIDVGSTEAIKHAVAAAMGIAWVSSLAVRDELALGTLVTLDVIDIHAERELSILTHADRPAAPVVEAFLTRLRE